MDLRAVARRYAEDRPDVPGFATLQGGCVDNVRLRLDEQFCRDMADYYDRAPVECVDDDLIRRYDTLKTENLRQLRAITEVGLRIEPWLGDGQPYPDSRTMIEHVRRTGVLSVYLTRAGHGPGPGTDSAHPLRAYCGIVLAGVPLRHNDVFRVVHDVFGHVMSGNGFGPRGEFGATYCHMRMYPADVHPVLFTEQIGQICWFFFGPHLRGPDGRLIRRGASGYRPPDRRPYPPQKVFLFDPEYLGRFQRLFDHEESR